MPVKKIGCFYDEEYVLFSLLYMPLGEFGKYVIPCLEDKNSDVAVNIKLTL